MAAVELLGYVPLLLVTVLALPVALVPVSDRARLLVSRLALPIFGRYVAEDSPTRRRQRERMRAAFVGESHRVFASQTLFIAGVAGVAGSVYGVYAGAAILRSLAVDVDELRALLPTPLEFLAAIVQVPNLSLLQLFGLLLVAGATVGSALALGTYWARWEFLDQRARTRGIEIDATLPRTVAFVYALSRSGIPFQEVLRTLSRNQDVYGEAARELGVAVRDMDTFGTDILTALQGTASRTPSENLEEFTENLASVLSSGQSVSSFLRDQYERFQEEAQEQQRQYLDLLSTFAEVYVTVLVAGPLFFITVLVVVGLVIQNTLTLVRIVSYVGIPLATFGFVVYVDSMTEGLNLPNRGGDDQSRLASDRGSEDDASGTQPVASAGEAAGVTDGGIVYREAVEQDAHAENRARLAVYDRIGAFRETLSHPLETVLRAPAYSLVLTGPIGLLLIGLSIGGDARDAIGRLTQPSTDPAAAVADLVAVVDGPIVLATILALAGVAAAHEVQKRRIRAIEADMPDFLSRMASINEAGVTVVGSLGRLADAELGRLGDEIARVWRDIRWGASVSDALTRMERRTNAPTVSRAVTLVRNAMAASGDISPVLHIAADEAQEIRRLRRERRQEMLTYLVVIYVSFFVFLGIIVALTVSFIPAIEAAGRSTGGAVGGVGGVNAGVLGGLQSVNTGAYELLFFHTAAIQGVCSGIVAGQLGEGSVADGLKHATVLLVATYLVFALL
ncbi:type II secretion system F family protein [Halobellus limi]|uniref:Flagellar protein FlaJ n=1 Tax=Halobellus limi TaxID=699433 RepID=A0A1H6C1S9_9EURY|nr:type II secretion system F family protein [Halobellus limi]QCC48545.1 secretion system protein [Halobellus limi]SEG66911.1 flagellar protein FlaJ [Halobellus limi]